MNDLQPTISKLEQNLIAIDRHIINCDSQIELWIQTKELKYIHEAALILKRKDIAMKAGSLICKAEFYLSKKIKLPDRAIRRSPEEIEKEDELGLTRSIKYKIRKAYLTLDENVFRDKIQELKEKEIVPTRSFFSNEESYQRFSGDTRILHCPTHNRSRQRVVRRH